MNYKKCSFCQFFSSWQTGIASNEGETNVYWIVTLNHYWFGKGEAIIKRVMHVPTVAKYLLPQRWGKYACALAGDDKSMQMN